MPLGLVTGVAVPWFCLQEERTLVLFTGGDLPWFCASMG